jgi:parallel beta-helix repeat protein
MGVIVSLSGSEDPDGDAVALLQYRTGSQPYKQGFTPTRVSDRFIGSLFWLTPGTTYKIRVILTDPDGDPVDGVVLQANGSTRNEIAVPAPNNKIYVSPSGGGNCNLASPCSLATGISQAYPGDAVILRGGTYHLGSISSVRSGTATDPIVWQAYSGEKSILDGADPATFTWTYYANGVYSTTINVGDTHFVMADGKRLFPYDDLTDLRNLSRGNTPGFYTSGTTLYVHLKNNKDPNTAVMVISRENEALHITHDHIYILDLTFRHYGQGSYAKAIYLNGASNTLVQKCIFENNDLGVGIKRAASENVIQDCTFSDTIFNWPWSDIKDVGGLEDGGIVFYDPVEGRGNIIRRNTFHDDFDGFGICPNSTAMVTNETDVYDNTIYNMGDDGVEADGRCSNVRIWGNTFYDVLMGISLAPVYDGPVYAIRNVIHRTGVGNHSYTGSPFKFNSGYSTSGPMYLFHNTADAYYSGNNGLYIKAPGTWDLIYARNNIWSGTSYAINNYNTSQPVNLDYDNLYNAGITNLVRWNSTNYATLTSFSAATGQESHGLSVSPGFADTDNGDYRLSPGSPMIDAGLSIPGINNQFFGTAPDLGAFEHSSSAVAAKPMPWIPLLLDE